MRYRTGHGIISSFLAFVLVVTCNSATYQPLAAFASDSRSISPSMEVTEEHASVNEPLLDALPNDFGDEAIELNDPLNVTEERDSSRVSLEESLDVSDEDANNPLSTSLQNAFNATGSAAASEIEKVAETSRDVTQQMDQLELGIASFTWKNTSNKYIPVEKTEDGSYRLPAPFEGIKGLHIALNFNILKNDETRTIREGDFFTFKLDQQKEDGSSKYFTLADLAEPKLISFGGAAIGKYTIQDNILKVVFDKDVNFEMGYTSIKGGIGLDFQLNDESFGVEDDTGLDLVLQDVTNPLHVIVPPKSSLIDGVEKSGVYDPETRSIVWTVKAGTESPGLNMHGMKIVDTFDAKALEFSSAALVAPDGSETDVTLQMQVAKGSCMYEFPAGSIAPQTLKIKTLVQEGALPKDSAVAISNDVRLEKGTSPYKPGSNSAASTATEVPGMGIQKLGEQVGGNRMQWSIVINDAEDAWLYNAVVTDTLASNLGYVPKTLNIDDREVPVLTSDPSPAPTSDYATLLPGIDGSHILKIHFVDTESSIHGNKPLISKRHRITFETELSGSSISNTEIRNEASLSGNWPSGSGVGPSFSHDMGIGAEYKYAYLDKKGSVETRTGVITWNINPQTRMDAFSEARIVDVVDASDQKFIAPSVSLEYQGTRYTQQDLSDKGWLMVSGVDSTDDPTKLSFILPQATFPQLKDVHITYQTQATEGFLNGQHGQTHTYHNTADLEVVTNQGLFQNSAKAEVPLSNNIIDKTATYEFDDAKGIGYLHYTLSINGNKMALSNVSVSDDFSTLKAAYYRPSGDKVADISPDSWVIDQDKTEIVDSSGSKKAYDDLSYDGNRFSVKLGSSPSFEITDTYTINLYVTLTPEAQQKFLLESGSGYIRTENEATITGTSAGGSIDRKAVHVTTPEGGDIKNELVDKSSILDKTDGTISWRVDVNPQAVTLKKAVVKDVLNKSLQLSHDSVKLYKSVHDAQGNIKPDMGDPISWDEVSNLTFEVEPGVDGSSVLSVALPDGKGAYTLLYDTTIVEAVSAGYVQNKASLINNGLEKGTGSHTQEVDEESWGYLERTASYRFQKVDAFGGGAQPLGKGVVFGLYSNIACTDLIKKVTANEGGIFGFYGLGAGKSYWYKELAAPEGYVLDPAAYELKVPAGTFGMQPLQTVANTRIVGVSPVSIEKQFAFDAGDVASSLTASFRLIMRPLGEASSKRVGVTLNGSNGSYAYVDVAVSPETATHINTTTVPSSETSVASLSMSGLPWGSYELVEIDAPKGYTLFEGGKKFTVGKDGVVTFDTTDFDVGTTPGTGLLLNKKTHISLHKQFNGTEAPVPGAAFALYDATGTSLAKSPLTGADYTWLPDGDSWEIIGLPVGSYILRETSPATDATIAQMPDVTFSVAANGALSFKHTVPNVSKKDQVITVNNITCKIIVKKADQRKDAVVGATLTLQRKTSSGDWENVRDLIDSVVGEGVDGTYEVTGLDRATTYRILETDTPAGYIVAAPIVFTIDVFGAVKDINLNTVGVDTAYANIYDSAKRTFTLCDERIFGHAQFVKQGEGGSPLAGVTFDLYREKTGGETADVCVNVSDPFTSDAKGLVSTQGASMKNADTGLKMSEGLVPGVYYFKETSAPADVVFNADNPLRTPSFTVQSDGSNRYTWTDLQRGSWPAHSAIEVGDGRVVNTALHAQVKVKKTSAEGSPLSGAVFSLVGTDVSGTQVDRELTTDAAGMALFDNVGAGEYEVQETTPPPGYIKVDQVFKVTVSRTDAGKTYEVNEGAAIKNAPNEFSVSKVRSGEHPIPLAGAQFKLEGTFADGSNIPLYWTSTDKPTAFLGTLLASTPEKEQVYTLTETKAPEGYEMTAASREIKINVQGELFQRESRASAWQSVTNNVIVVTNGEKRGSLSLLKVDASTKAPLQGVAFSLFDKITGEEKGSYSTDAHGKILVTDLAWGTYYAQEKSAEGYGVSSKQYEFTIGVSARGVTINADMGVIENEPIALTFSKQELYAERCSDSDLGADASDALRPLAGAEFTLYRDEGCTQVAKTIVGTDAVARSSATGLVEFKYIPAGSYWMKETLVPAGHVKHDVVYIAVVAADGAVERFSPVGRDGVVSQVVNDVYRADIVIKKVAETNESKVLPDSTYGLFKQVSQTNQQATPNMLCTSLINTSANVSLLETTDQPDKDLRLIAKATTDKQGVLVFKGVLMDERYVIKELVAPDGSLVSEKPISIMFDADTDGNAMIVSFDDGSGTAIIDKDGNIVWREPQVRVSFNKKDPDGQPLAGAKLQVLDSAGAVVVEPWTSDTATGYEVEGALIAGATYQLVELEAPEGYIKADPLTFIVENPVLGPDQNFIQQVDLVNQRVSLNPPIPANPPKIAALSKTGDTPLLAFLGGVMTVSACVVGASILRRRRMLK